ncbi:hypothetical protein KC19_VG161900 [Ceratodon purpureus]|uniref:Uncharacterized protein n=1 Tax=Ceratodon purpureus TaxID=3225 RepID=A0A8T0HQN4_CERPU|nr:hypothetical protein KC19_VG161900 [Ceratodon purpureus]
MTELKIRVFYPCLGQRRQRGNVGFPSLQTVRGNPRATSKNASTLLCSCVYEMQKLGDKDRTLTPWSYCGGSIVVLETRVRYLLTQSCHALLIVAH